MGFTLLLFILGMVLGNEYLGDDVDSLDMRDRKVMGDDTKRP